MIYLIDHQDSFTYNAKDNSLTSNTVEVIITVYSTPVSLVDTFSTAEDIKLEVIAANGVLKNDSDPDGDTLQAVLVSQTGRLTLNSDGSLVYNPQRDFNGTDIFYYLSFDRKILVLFFRHYISSNLHKS